MGFGISESKSGQTVINGIRTVYEIKTREGLIWGLR